MKKEISRMLNKTYRFGGKLIRVDQISHIEGDIFLIRHPLGELKVSQEELDMDFELIPDSIQVINQNKIADLAIKEASDMQDLSAILRENIKKVSEDPDYVKQAAVVNDSVSQIINLQKTKIEAFKLARNISS